MSDLTIHGPIGTRDFYLAKACNINEGHEHNYDHTTIVINGRIKVLYSYIKDGQVIEGESGEYGAGEKVVIKAKVRHTIKALEDNTRYMCVFSHRDFNGLVTQNYMGNVQSYN